MKKTITLYNDYDISLCDIAEALEINESEITDSDWQFYFDTIAENLEYHLSDLDKYPAYIITADIGRWNGRYKGFSYISNLSDLRRYLEDLSKIVYNQQKGTIDITTSHHDATNYLTIKPISTRGEQYYLNHYNDNGLIEKIATTRGLTTKFKI